MAACRNFFDEPISSLRRSSSLNFSPPPEVKEEAGAHCLELTLGLGPPVSDISASSPPQHDTVRPTSVYPYVQKQPSGKVASSAPPITVDASQVSFAQFDASKVPGTFIGQADVLAKQRSGNLASLASTGNGGHTLLTFEGQSNAVLAVKALLPPGNSTFPSRDQIWQTLQKNGTLFEQNTQHPDQASTMWSRRSASMQVMVPGKDVDDENCRIRRSCSNGVLPRTLSCHVSNIQSSLERSPQQNTVSSHYHHQESLEDLQKRKEMQAHRRQVARKRRKILIEEKQHKKTRQSNSLQRLGSRQMPSPDDKFSHIRTPSVEDDVAPETQCVSPDESKPAKPENQGMVDMMQNLHSEEARQESHGICVVGGKLITSGNEYNHGSYSSPLPAVTVTTGQAGGCVNEDEGAKSCPSSDTDCAENSNIQNDISELELSGQRSASEFGDGVRVSSGLSMSGMANGLTGFRPFPFLPIPCGNTVAGAMSTTVAMQPNFPFPYFMQYPVTSNCGKDSSIQSLPTLQGTCSVVGTTFMGTSPPSAVISKTSFASKDWEGQSSEGKGGSSEKSAFTPLWRTVSNSKHIIEEHQCLDARLESQVSFPASQLSSLTGVVSDASSNKSLSLERQQSMPLGGRPLSQNSTVQDQLIARSKQERPIIGQRGRDVPHETPTLTMIKEEVKHEEGVKQEEGSSESQLASEHSGMDVSYVQSGIVEKQKNGTLPDLPWVTTTGKGPNGKTINGVMYIANGRHVRLVCSCHGKHMSPAEFVEHSGSIDLSNPERSIVVSPFPSLNTQLASTPV